MKKWTKEQWQAWQQKVIREEMKELMGNKYEIVRK